MTGTEDAHDFLRRVSEDEDYRGYLERALGEREDVISATVLQAARDGYRFDETDLEAMLAQLGCEREQLSDTELAEISGGFDSRSTPPASVAPGDHFRDVLSRRVRLRF